MNFEETIAPYASNVLSYHVIKSILQNYKRPNDKISELLAEGKLISLKKGMYIVGDSIKAPKPASFLIANCMLGPSYVSLDAALSWYKFIPERVYVTSSITIKNAQIINNQKGTFEYIQQATPFYSVGICQIQLTTNQYVIMANPEKALFDKIITTVGLQFQSKKVVMPYLTENLRIDEENLKRLDIKKMRTWLTIAPKKNTLTNFIKALENL